MTLNNWSTFGVEKKVEPHAGNALLWTGSASCRESPLWTGRTAAEFLDSTSESTSKSKTKTGEGCVCMDYRWKPSKDKKIRIKRYKVNSWEKGSYNWVPGASEVLRIWKYVWFFLKYLHWFYLKNIKYLENCIQQIVYITWTSSIACTMGFDYKKILL